MNKKRHICFFTGKRGGFNHLIPIMELIEKIEKLDYSIIGADMHLSEAFGGSITEVERWAMNVYKVDTMLGSDSKVARAKSLGIGIINFSQLLEIIKPDLVFVLGDRGEVLAMVIAAMELNIPIVHLFGGDVCQGGVDEPVRHAITKLANIHLASNKESADRILKMGEEPWRIFNVGSPVLDQIKQKKFTSREDVIKKFKLDANKPILILLQHSVTWQVEDTGEQIRKTLDAIDELKYQTIAVYPCSDPGYNEIINALLEYKEKEYFQLYKNIEFLDFWGLMNTANVFIGNSSAGVMETASFKIPFINIGIRQQDRLRSDNVIDVGHNTRDIVNSIKKALYDQDFKKRVESCVSPYGDGKASERIINILENLKFDKKLIRKKMTY